MSLRVLMANGKKAVKKKKEAKSLREMNLSRGQLNDITQ
jgi:hypothetical protein